MKKTLLSFFCAFCFLHLMGNAQNTAIELVKEGIQYHDNGAYKKAIESYKKALLINPSYIRAKYEIAYSYSAIKEYQKSIDYCNQVIEGSTNAKERNMAYVLKGSCLDMQGKTKESIAFFKNYTKQYGDHYLILYNLGINYLKLNKLKEAEKVFMRSILHNPKYSSSHLRLGEIQNKWNNKARALLPLYMFLLLEPNSKRSKPALNIIKETFAKSNGKNKNGKKNYTININASDTTDKSILAAETMLSLMIINEKSKNNKKLDDNELLYHNTKLFFGIIHHIKKNNNPKGIWWEFYADIYGKILTSDHLKTYCYIINLSVNSAAEKWIIENKNKLNAFGVWLDNNEN